MTEALPSLSKRVRDGALWSVLSTLILRLANIGITAIVARILSPRDFGVFAVALTAYAIVSAVGQLGVASCLMRADLDVDAMAPTLVTVSMVTNAALASAMALFAQPIAGALGSAAGAEAVRIMALALILEGIFAVPYGQLTRDFKQDKLFWANAISFVPSTIILLFLAKSGHGALAFAWSRVATQLILGCVIVAFVPRIYTPGMARDALSLLLKFGLPLAGANLVNYILLNVDYAFVGHLTGAVALGAYVLAFTVASWPAGLLSGVINTVSMPAFSRVKHDPELLKSAMGNALRAVSLIVMPMSGLMIALSQPLVLTLYGAKWATAAGALSILSLYGAISIICVLFANMLTSLGKAKFILVVQLIWLGALVPAMAVGVHRDGIYGAAVAHIVIIAPLILPSYVLALRKATGVHFTTLAKAVLPSLLAAAVAAFAARGAASLFSRPLMQLVAGVGAGGLVYLALAAPQGVALLGQQPADAHGVRGLFRGYANVARLLRDGRRTTPVPVHVPYHGRPADAPVYRSVGERVASGRGSNATLRGSYTAASGGIRTPRNGPPKPATGRRPRPGPSAQRGWLAPVTDIMETRMMREQDQAGALGLSGRGHGPGGLWPHDGIAEDRGADPAVGLVSLGFIGAALRRSRWLWVTTAIVGLIIGAGLHLKSPPQYQASTTLLLTVGPEAQPGTAILDNQAIAQSRSVAALAVQRLGTRQDPGAFLSTYTAAVVTDRVLRITVSASSSAAAVNTANVVATAFLSFRAGLLEAQQQLQITALNQQLSQQVSQEKQHIKTINGQIQQVSAQPASSGQQTELTSLKTQREQADNQLTAFEVAANESKASSQVTTSQMISQSKVLDPASPFAHSRFKGLVIYGAVGLLIGLALGMGIVLLRAVTSDRLYRRDDIAHALGAPIMLTVPARPAARRLMGSRGLAAADGQQVQRVVAHLRRAVRTGPHHIATLAVVPVDDPEAAALSVTSLALSYARQGKRVVLADLCRSAPAGQLLGVKAPGAQQVSVDGVQLEVVIPDGADVTPTGPLGVNPAEPESGLGQIAAACASAEVLLTLAVLDPTAGAEHLVTWATEAVVVVETGRSWTRIHAVGEMIRLAGTQLVSAVLVGIEKSDKSLGIPRMPLADHDFAEEETADRYGEGPAGDAPAAGTTDGTQVSGVISR